MPEVDAEFSSHLARVLEQLGLSLGAGQVAMLELHYATLRHWNRKINLTAIRDPAEIAERHFGESLFLAKHLGESPATMLDVGSGAGFPGIPLAVCHPACQVTLLEPVGKKVAFLKEISRSMSNVSVLQRRLDEVEGVFEWATVRGVSLFPIRADLRAAARLIAVLTTREAMVGMRLSEEISWERELALPWGNQRILLLGQHSSNNPRST